MDENKRDTGGGSGNEIVRLARRDRERRRHREEILAAAAEVFARNGYNKASMQMIAEEAELSVGMLYTHFEGKEAIYREIVDQHLASVVRACDEVTLEGMSPLETIRVRTRAAIEHFESRFDFIRLYFDTVPSGMKEQCKRIDEIFVEMISKLLQRAIEAGELRKDFEPLLLAIMMEGAVHKLLEWHAERDLRDIGMVPDLIDEIFIKPLETGGKSGSEAEEDK